MFIVTYTVATVHGTQTVNSYKEKTFRDLSDATDFYNKQQDKPNACDLKLINRTN
jgi:hypothetical protein